VKLNGIPKLPVAEALLVNVGTVRLFATVSVSDWVAGLPLPLSAVIVIG
jgi:hypothetical protein